MAPKARRATAYRTTTLQVKREKHSDLWLLFLPRGRSERF